MFCHNALLLSTYPFLAWLSQVVQEIKVLRSGVSQRERERAERATLVEQERLIKAKVGHMSPHILVIALPPEN